MIIEKKGKNNTSHSTSTTNMNSDSISGSQSSPDADPTSAPSQNYDNDDIASQVEEVSPNRGSQTVGDDKSPKRNLPTAGGDESGRDNDNDAQFEAEHDTSKAKGLDNDNDTDDGGRAVAADGGHKALSCDDDEDNHDDDDDDDGANANQQLHEVTFPQKLMEIIEKEVRDGAKVDGEPVLDWGEEGKSFLIRDKAMFERRVLPRHFTAKCKFMSFVRKLYRQVLFVNLTPIGILSRILWSSSCQFSLSHAMHVFLLAHSSA